METVLQNPSTLTPLALLGLVAVQIAQLFRGHMDAKAGRAAKYDDSLAAILQRVMDQHAAASERQAAAMERIAASMTEVQNHMHNTNAALSSFTTRLEAVERQLGQDPAAIARAILAAPIKPPASRSRASKAD